MNKKMSVRDVIPFSAACLCLILFILTIEALLLTEHVSADAAIFEVEREFNIWDFKDRVVCAQNSECSKVPKHMFEFLHGEESISIVRGEFSKIPYMAISNKGKVTFFSALFAILVFFAVVPLWRVWREDELTSIVSLISQGALIVYLSEFVLGT